MKQSNFSEEVQRKINQKTKPLGALGILEQLAFQIAHIQQSLSPTLQKPHIVVFAADHGIAEEGVSAYPQEVTWQMVYNFLNGGAAINVFARQHQIALQIVDAGVKHSFDNHPHLIHQKIAWGTQNFKKQPAMTPEQMKQCLQYGRQVVQKIAEKGCNVIGFGEMGIANTSSASVLMSLLLEIPIEECVGAGTGLSSPQIEHKKAVLKESIARYPLSSNPEDVLHYFGGFEIAQMVGAILEAYEHKMVILVDGFIASAAFLVAYAMNPSIKENAIFCHQSAEKGHQKLLDMLGVSPIMNLSMRLGEGTGCAVAYPILESAVRFLTEMASFDDAQVSKI
jgi:nicotinate-nucleotide--dimethylbenzimidazole phosphoribosyltransferase